MIHLFLLSINAVAVIAPHQGPTGKPRFGREMEKEYVFLTNRFDLSALEVAELYRRGWQIESFFKWIKQNLKIKAFYGTSKNGELIKIWTAWSAYLLPVWLKFKSKTGLVTPATHPTSPNQADGAPGLVGFALPTATW
jgi:hypothetical protein